MNILFICHRLPYPPKQGGTIRSFNMIKYLHDAGHQVTVASLARSSQEYAEGQGLADFCDTALIERVNPIVQNLRMVLYLFGLVPSSMAYFFSRKLKRRINQLLRREKFDFILVHCSSVAQYVEKVDSIPKLLDFTDMDSQKWLIYSRIKKFPKSLGYWLEGTKLQRAEQLLAKKFDYCTVITEAELETLDQFQSGTPGDWFPNGVDTEYFVPTEEAYEPYTLSFIGRMDYYPNQAAMFWFCEQVWPLLKQKCPQAKLLIIGAEPSLAVKQLAELDGVEVTGSVVDVRPYVRRSAVNIAPLDIARGTQNKLLESMAMGVPVVASPVAARGIDANAGEHFLQANTPQEYCEQILKIVNDPESRKHFANVGRQRVLSNHNWPSAMQRMEKMIHECVENHIKKNKPTDAAEAPVVPGQ